MAIDIKEHVPGKDMDAFVRVPFEIFRNDPNWVPPLEKDIRDRLTPAKNPFFDHAQATLFTAWKDGKLVGRCSAQVDHEHQRIHGDGAAFFGFFDTVEDPAVGTALIDAASAWAKGRGARVLRGPFSLSLYEEAGLLVEGFDSPPLILMPYSTRYQAGIAEATGLAKAKDLFAWKYEAGKLPRRALKAWESVRSMPEVRIRSVNVAKMEQELPLIMEVFNDAWGDNWGHVPATEREVEKAAKDLKLIVDPDLVYIVEIEGRAMAMCVALPNLNEAIHDLGGKLLPFGFFKLLWRMKVKHPSSARLMMLGVRRELRHVKRYGALSTAMYVELHKRGTAKGYNWGELSWTLEDNAPVNLAIRAMGGSVYKKYRVYEKDL